MMKMILPVVLLVCGIILVMNSFMPMPRMAVIVARIVGMPILIYTVWNLIKKVG